MNGLSLNQSPVAKTGMLIRRPVAAVFEAFIDPKITSQFWFTQGSGRLEAGKQVEWTWAMYGFTVPVQVQSVEPPARIVVEWPGEAGPTTIEWRFTPHGDGATFVEISNSGFTGNGDSLVKQATDATEGFSLVLAGLKAWLEHGVRLNLVADRFPQGIAGT